MVFTKDYKFPTDEELTVEECPLGTPYLKAGSFHLGKYCEAQNNEFVLCKHETRDPVKCLEDGRAVTACTNEFFRKVGTHCSHCDLRTGVVWGSRTGLNSLEPRKRLNF